LEAARAPQAPQLQRQSAAPQAPLPLRLRQARQRLPQAARAPQRWGQGAAPQAPLQAAWALQAPQQQWRQGAAPKAPLLLQQRLVLQLQAAEECTLWTTLAAALCSGQ